MAQKTMGEKEKTHKTKNREGGRYIHLCHDDTCECSLVSLESVASFIFSGRSNLSNPFNEWSKESEMAFKRVVAQAVPAPPKMEWKDDVDMRDMPVLYSFLHDNVFDDGKPRITGSISIFTKMGCLRASITDKDAGKYCYVEALSLMELIATIENAICSDKTEWIISSKTPPY